MNDGPHGRRYKSRRVRGPSVGVEVTAPARQVVERHGRGADDPAVEVIREVLSFLEALPPTRRASEVVRFGVLLSKEGLGDFLAHDHARVHGTVREILDDLAVVVEGHAGLSIVAIVGGHGGEALVDGVGQVIELDAPANATIPGAQEATGPCLGRREPDFHGKVGAVGGGHEQVDPAHVDGDDLGAGAARSGGFGEAQICAGCYWGGVTHRRVGIEGADGRRKVGAFGVKIASAVLRYRRCGSQDGAQGEGS